MRENREPKGYVRKDFVMRFIHVAAIASIGY